MQGRGGEKGEKWENCNNIINKIYFKKVCAFVRGGEFEQYKEFLEIKNVTAKVKELLNKVKNKKKNK